MNGWRDLLQDKTPWGRETIRRFQWAAVVTLLMVIVAYAALWSAVQGRIPIWAAFLSEGLSVGLTYLSIRAALIRRRQEILSAKTPSEN